MATCNTQTGAGASDAKELFSAYIKEKGFPCVGAKSALATGKLNIVPARDLTSGWNDVAIHDALLKWAYAYKDDPGGMRSLAVVFEGPTDLSEEAFEKHMWDRIQSLADKDEWRGQPYDSRVSADPESPHFSLSFGGEGFFVVGMHPNASRPARRFALPTLVFNLHDQFERLREDGRYETMRETILDRDRKLAGNINPMLSRHGEDSEARQYSGRQVGEDWEPPFKDRRS
ncbi:guanitoxin biosynthesis heme-dependent pre-guanitoxin N-hydroxylase GntA [Aurantiacibacter poecillastricola]|uniref:guanitoxin biosynthesis heme-dependent pre-guanitoxin N-hydroxylase GntA n=1 Tax=Aurantiacibacter poecillastricola TaxID=3064385 RepID=UPI00273CFF2B|nr:guanitoxin biosynthesis heme-dependent pre-guanitoxin N-hydroxylase GntA [Aurantiacibacter sp. 219JJ12-13]MDP5261141.1 guanitoxin biosynthesis heme-dependent pre-guanitoxin N-hydroxylase GntA [Aurantiacibacter sp. 219JJ12-13]